MLRIFDWDLGGGRVEGHYTNVPDPAGMAIQEGLPEAARRARELEALGYYDKPLSFKWREKTLLVAAGVEDLDPDTVRALRAVIEEAEPEWVERVRAEIPSYGDDLFSLSYYSEVPPQAVRAIIEIMRERGDLPG